jgi:1-acyl-sn-glycerol-3-phosphate acyltransferase
MHLLNNTATLALSHFILTAGSRNRVVGLEHLREARALGRGSFVLAAAHLSHYDPPIIASLIRHRVAWMARDEFYRRAFSRWWVESYGAIRTPRCGPALPCIREAMAHLKRGETVGIFPEGEVCAGPASVLHGGPIKGGAALLARRAGVPILPCVLLNAQQFTRVTPWLPLRRGTMQLGFGPLLYAPLDAKPGRDARRALTLQLGEALRDTHAALTAHTVGRAEPSTPISAHTSDAVDARHATP